MCGRPNPADRDVCQYCEARLKPLTGPISENASTPQSDEEDWLGSLRSEADMSDEEASDWTEEDFREEGENQRDPLDWLENIDQQTGAAAAPGPQAEQPQETPQTQPEEPISEPEGEQVDLAAWLASLDEEDQEPAAAEPPQAEEAGDQPLEFESRQSVSASNEPDEELPEWLSDFGEDPQTTPVEEPAAEEDLPDWLTDLGEAPAAGAETETAPEIPSSDDLEAAQDEVPAAPDWLQENAGAVEATPEEESETEAELPDWLQGIESEPSADEAEEYVPDFSAEFPAQEPEAPEAVSGEGAEEEPVDEWEWEAPAPELPEEPAMDLDEAAAEEAAEPIEAGEMPEWLADLEPEEPLDETGELAGGELPEPSQETAEWLLGLASEVESGQEPGEQEAADLDVPFTFEGTAEEFSEMDLSEEPDWLSELDEQAAEQAGEGTADELARADLPEWLAAMRPVDSVVTPRAVPEETGMDVESAGPLSGLHDVLPAEPEVFQINKPEIQSVKLNVSEGQQKHILMLNRMLREAAQPEAAVPAEGLGSQHIFRWVIALVLFVAVIVGLFSGFSIGELPVPAAEVQAVNQAIEALPAQAPVLVAFDYEPGLSGELAPLAEALLNHLMLRGAALTLVSTTPTGPVLGEGVIQSLQQQHNYVRSAQFVNLGYIPGGPTGLQSFSSLPLPFLLPYTFSGYQAWEPRLAPLSGVEGLEDYALLLVLTDRQETARAWIEQVGPLIGTTPLLLGTSAQIEPIIRPYYSGTPNLVDGFVSGIAGSGAYERLTGVDGWTSSNWNVYTLLVIVSLAVLLIGGLINLVLGSRSPSSKPQGESEP